MARMKLLSALAAFLFCVSSVEAHEAIFAWTYTTDLTPKGHGEFEQWITPRWEKEQGNYSVIDFREELEYGVTDDFQIALYLNHHYVYANDDVPAENPAHPKRRRGDGDFGACRNASHRSRALRLARASEPWQRVAVPWHVWYSDRHWIRTLLRRR